MTLELLAAYLIRWHVCSAGWVSELSLPSGKATELLILEQIRLHLSFSLMSRGN